MADLNPVIGTHREVMAPSSLHGLSAFHAIAHSIHEEMVLSHERGQGIDIVFIDCSDEPLERSGRIHCVYLIADLYASCMTSTLFQGDRPAGKFDPMPSIDWTDKSCLLMKQRFG
jgi:hypothetical protein